MAKLCTPRGEIYPLTVSGHMKLAWLDVELKAGDLLSPLTQKRRAQAAFRIVRLLAGTQLLLEDQGDMAMSFAADGRAKG